MGAGFARMNELVVIQTSQVGLSVLNDRIILDVNLYVMSRACANTF
jgi:hypothetical protein